MKRRMTLPLPKRTVPREKLSNMSMVAGGEKKRRYVIDNGHVKQWVGIGWIDLHPATAEDKRRYETVA